MPLARDITPNFILRLQSFAQDYPGRLELDLIDGVLIHKALEHSSGRDVRASDLPRHASDARPSRFQAALMQLELSASKEDISKLHSSYRADLLYQLREPLRELTTPSPAALEECIRTADRRLLKVRQSREDAANTADLILDHVRQVHTRGASAGYVALLERSLETDYARQTGVLVGHERVSNARGLYRDLLDSFDVADIQEHAELVAGFRRAPRPRPDAQAIDRAHAAFDELLASRTQRYTNRLEATRAASLVLKNIRQSRAAEHSVAR
jgi:hypothetical protein